MENVPEILIKANGFFKDAVFERFRTLGYHVEAEVLNAAAYGVPQWRRRAIFLAGRDFQRVSFPERAAQLGPRPGNRTPSSRDLIGDTGSDDDNLSLFETPKVGPTVWGAISDLAGRYAQTLDGPSPYATGPQTEYQRARRGDLTTVHNHFPWRLTERQLQRIRLLKEGQGQLHLPPELQTKNGYGSAYRRMQADAQALTITTWMFHPGSGMFTHPKEDRTVTIREAARLQSFQDDFVFCGKYHSQCRQVGNSVAPLVAKSLAAAVLRTLSGWIEPPPAAVRINAAAMRLQL